VPGGGGPTCTWWNARTTFVPDGDTIWAKLAGSRRTWTVRFVGINAMELRRYSAIASRRRGACHGVEATDLVDRLIRRSHGRVRLAAQNPASRSGGRLLRSVWVKRGGRWQDLSRIVLGRGLALWLSQPVEYAHNADYAALAQRVAAERRGLFAPSACGDGPDQDASIEVDVNWDADGDDALNLDGEWVELRNRGPRPLPLGGWWLRDAGHRVSRTLPKRSGYAFPSGVVIPPGGAVRLHTGCGADTATDLHWCERTALFQNVTRDDRHIGDGAYLFDPQGDLRAFQIYPCTGDCSDPLQGRVAVTAQPRGGEAIGVRNLSGAPADLSGHVLKLHSRSHPGAYVFSYPLPNGTVLAPGETLTLRVQGDLGRPPRRLADAGGAVSLLSFTDIVVDCFVWGDGRC
jgi:endonuclease YncB( thermonuclease family)